LPAGELYDKVVRNDTEAVKKLLAAGADINVTNATGAFTHYVGGIMEGGVSMGLAELLLSKEANVDETDTSGPAAGYPCLIIAARNKKSDLVKFLIKNGANVNAKVKDSATPLSMAIKENDVAMIKLLKDLGA